VDADERPCDVKKGPSVEPPAVISFLSPVLRLCAKSTFAMPSPCFGCMLL